MAGTSSGCVDKTKIDESLYSRQLNVLGEAAMREMSHAKIMISGMDGLGIEIAKNLVLVGIQEIVIHDEELTTNLDLSSQFFLGMEDIGKNRASSSFSALKDLNRNVNVTLLTEELKTEDFNGVNIAIFCCGISTSKIYKFSDYCHDKGIGFILAQSRGLFFRVFCDFGETFVVYDPDEAEPEPIPVTRITNDENGIVYCLVETSHGLQVGDMVLFNDVKGMSSINREGVGRRVTEILSTNSFKIGDTTDFHIQGSGGTVVRKKVQKTIHFKNLRSSSQDPSHLNIDYSKNPLQTHLAFEVFQAFENSNQRTPQPLDDNDVALLQEIAETINDKNRFVKQIDTETLQLFIKSGTGSLGPVTSFLGGFVAQEAIKGCSGKFVPLQQWLIGDFLECLPRQMPTMDLNDTSKTLNNRYFGGISVIGEKLQEKLANLKVFVVGAGAIGCEILKNLALMGVGSGINGEIIVTDNDFIERSNLSRQFLFREADIAKLKSEIAVKSILKINPEIKIKAMALEVGVNDEANGLNHEFYSSLDCVVNALDNVSARKHMDEKCVDYFIPLLESGTHGVKGSTQVVVPGITKCYRDTNDPPSTSIPMCTLKFFPYRIEHTIQWARDLFEEVFKSGPTAANLYKSNRGIDMPTDEDNLYSIKETLTHLKSFFEDKTPTLFEECVQWARNKYEELFVDEITSITKQFPSDHVNSVGGIFWSGNKRFPRPYIFKADDPLCFEFVFTAANLRSFVFNIPQILDKTRFRELLKAIKETRVYRIPQPKKLTTENDFVLEHPPSTSEVKMEEIRELISVLPEATMAFQKLSIEPLLFEKDDDTNLHVDFIMAASNLRAWVYSIEQADRLKTKKIAGNIIPAIATTTSVVAALSCLELYKLFDEEPKDVLRFRDSYVSLAVPKLMMFVPKKATVVEDANGFKWSIWNYPKVHGNVTIKQLLKALWNDYKISASVISFGDMLLYFDGMPDSEIAENINKTITDIIEMSSGVPVPLGCTEIKLHITSSNEVHKDIQIPPVRCYLV